MLSFQELHRASLCDSVIDVVCRCTNAAARKVSKRVDNGRGEEKTTVGKKTTKKEGDD